MATLKGFPCSLHLVISYAWMTWIFCPADTTLFLNQTAYT